MTLLGRAKKLIRRGLAETAEAFGYWHAGEEIAINATLTRPDPNLMALAGSVTSGAEHYDLLVNPAELFVDSQQIEPARGVLITKTGTTRRFSVVHRGDVNQPCWRWSDGSKMFMRVYLVEIEGAIPDDFVVGDELDGEP